MAKIAPIENRAVARRFIDKFGFNLISVDAFDLFIIDEHLAQDPETDDKKDVRYKGFVQDRGAAKRMLNNAGTYINGSSFQITVRTPGINYEVSPWAVNTREIGREIGNRISEYTKNRISSLKALQSKAEHLRVENPDDTELAETFHMLSLMRTQGVELQARVRGLVTQYNVAADAVEDQVKLIVATYDNALLENDED